MSGLSIVLLFLWGLNAISVGRAQQRAARREAQFYFDIAEELGRRADALEGKTPRRRPLPWRRIVLVSLAIAALMTWLSVAPDAPADPKAWGLYHDRG